MFKLERDLLEPSRYAYLNQKDSDLYNCQAKKY